MRRGKLLKVRNNEKLSFQRLHCNQLEGRKHSGPSPSIGRFPQLLWLFSTLQATDPLRRDRRSKCSRPDQEVEALHTPALKQKSSFPSCPARKNKSSKS